MATIQASSTPSSQLTAAEFAVVGRIAATAAAGPFPHWLDEMLHLLRHVAAADASELFLRDRDAGALSLAGCDGPDSAAFDSVERFDRGLGYPGIVAESQDALITRELRTDPRYMRAAVSARGYHACAVVPLIRGAHLIGTLHLAWKRKDPDVEHGVAILQAVAPVVTTALLAARGDLESPAPLDGSRPLAQWLHDQAERLQRFTHAEDVSVALLHPDAKGVLDCGSTGSGHVLCSRLTESGLDGCPHASTLRRGLVLSGPRASWPAPCSCSLPAGFTHVIEVPLRHGRETHGFACLGWRQPPTESPSHLLASLLFLDWSVPTDLSSAPSAPLLPAILTSTPATGAHHLSLQCFGPFNVYVDGHLLHRRAFTRSKAIDLLKTLIMRQGRPISRDALVERLWPDADPDSGARSLHVAMHDLRRVVEPKRPGRQWDHVLSQGDTFLLDLGAHCSLDLKQWRDLLAAARTASARADSDAETIDLLERAVSLYRGDLFSDDLDSQWFLAARQTCRTQLLEALLQLARLYEHHHEPDRGVLALKHAVEIEPLRENLHQRLIEALQRSNRLDEARRCYDVFLQLACSSHDSPPSADMRRLGHQLGFDGGRPPPLSRL